MTSNKIKTMVTEFLIYTIVIVVSSVGLIQTTKYKQNKTTSQYYLNGKLNYLMVSVPVPIDVKMEGQSIDYKITCSMKKNNIECVENG